MNVKAALEKLRPSANQPKRLLTNRDRIVFDCRIANDSAKMSFTHLMELRFECPTCGQHLSATREQISMTAACLNLQ
jgi:transcription initiation factor IIE alpha subunit